MGKSSERYALLLFLSNTNIYLFNSCIGFIKRVNVVSCYTKATKSLNSGRAVMIGLNKKVKAVVAKQIIHI